MTTVLFWDIDGTLLTTGRAGIFALESAAEAVIGHPVDLTHLNTAGLTDVEIAREILTTHRVTPTPEKVNRLLSLYGESLPASLPRRQGQVMPGVIAILEALRSHPHVLSLLLTGNIRAGARAKLHHYGLADYFEQGVFSDHADDRPSIARQGLEMAKALVRELSPDNVYVIGDTPHDIRCGHAIQARTIAVATGSYSLAQLQAHTPWWLIEQLPPPAVFFQKVGLLT